MNKAIEEVLKNEKLLGVKGKKSTPFLLKKVSKIINGVSLKASIKQVMNNAKLAAKIAKAFHA